MATNLGILETELRTRLAHMLQRVGAIEGDLRATRDDDWVERATEIENDAVLERLDDLTRQEVQQIRRALDRLATGKYGVCTVCGHAIDASRLSAVPTATTCVGCRPATE